MRACSVSRFRLAKLLLVAIRAAVWVITVVMAKTTSSTMSRLIKNSLFWKDQSLKRFISSPFPSFQHLVSYRKRPPNPGCGERFYSTDFSP